MVKVAGNVIVNKCFMFHCSALLMRSSEAVVLSQCACDCVYICLLYFLVYSMCVLVRLRKVPLTHQAQPAGTRWLTGLMRKAQFVCMCAETIQLTRQDRVNTRTADESEGAVHFTCACGCNASVSRAVSQQDSKCVH